MSQHNCETCKFRAKYDQNPSSILGKTWRWHINICPGWKKYYQSLDSEKKREIREKYNLK